MNVQLDLETYRTRFSEAQKSNLFFCLFDFPKENDNSDGANSKEPTFTLAGRISQALSIPINDKGTSANSYVNTGADIIMKALVPFGFGSEKDKYPYLVKSANIPSVDFDERSYETQFTNIKMPGIKNYSDWVVTFNIDADIEILNKFYNWINLIQSNNFVKTTFSKIVRDQQIFLLNGEGNIVSGYKLYGAWPKSIGEVSLDYSSNEHASVQVTFSYLYFDPIEITNKVSYKNEVIRKIGKKILGLI